MNSSVGLTLGAIANVAEPSDAELARRADADSFALLYQRHLPAVFAYVSGRLRSHAEAEDLTSDVFRQAWSGRHGYRGHGTFRAWIFSIVRHRLADLYRRHRVDACGQLSADEAEDVQDSEASPEDHAVRGERVREVHGLLDGLTAEQQEILRLRFGAELSYAEIASVIGKREDAVKKIAYRALESLRGRTDVA